MGREIRRVPMGWEHPIDPETKRLQPMHDKSYEAAAKEWIANMLAWEGDTHEILVKDPKYKETCPHWWEWEGMPPDKQYYHPEWGDTATAYQVYENVTEGTPVSPVFKTQGAMRNWLADQGYSSDAVDVFLEKGYAPTGMVVVGVSRKPRIYRDIATLDIDRT